MAKQNEESSHVVEAGLATISRGELLSAANFQLQRAIENCLDPNTESKANRTLTIKVVIKPNATRTCAEVAYQVDLKCPTDSAGADQIFIRQQDGKAFVPKGEQMTFETFENDEVTRLRRASEKE
jgi:hypothetical protein